MKKVGDIYWCQLSMWEFASENCIEAYRKHGRMTFHYVLKKVVKETSPNSWRTSYIDSANEIPAAFFLDGWSIFQKIDGQRIQIPRPVMDKKSTASESP